jgi:uncharacterized protein YndB with AHSA1/START domain
MTAETDVEREFTLTRMLDAPRELVFQAWTDPNQLQWFVNDTTTTSKPIEVDLRVGGAWRLEMVIDESTRYVTGGVYREIVPVERLVFSWGAPDGWPEIDPDRPDDGPVVTVTLNEAGDKTEMIFHLLLPDHLSQDSVREWLALGIRDGWNATIDRLVTKFAGVVSRS